jgi:ABC-2 type transport system permease protein
MAKALRDQRRSLLLWCLAEAAVVAVYIPVFTQYEDTGGLTQQAGALPTGVNQALGFDEIGTAAGYVQATVYGLLAMLLMLVFAITTGARAVAGEEESGTLDLYLAHPLTRRRLVQERAAALTVGVIVLGAVLGVTVWAFTTGLGLDVPATGIAAASLALALLGSSFGCLAIAVGGLVGRRAIALGATAAAAVLLYLTNAVAPQVAALDGLQGLSPFHWYLGQNTVITGFGWGFLALLALLPPVLMITATTALGRRDINT